MGGWRRNPGKASQGLGSARQPRQETGALGAPWGGRAGPLNGVSVGADWRVAWVVCAPLAGTVCRDHVQDPAFAPSTSEVAFLYLVVHNLLSWRACSYF